MLYICIHISHVSLYYKGVSQQQAIVRELENKGSISANTMKLLEDKLKEKEVGRWVYEFVGL